MSDIPSRLDKQEECPREGAAGNVCTEDLVFMCAERGIDTGIDLEKLVDAARLAGEVVGHGLPGSVKLGGSLDSIRQKLPKSFPKASQKLR